MVEIDGIFLDTSEFEASLEQLDRHAQITSQSVLKEVKRGYSSLMIMAEIFGIAIPQLYHTLYAATIMMATTMQTLATAESFTGVLVAKAAITFTIAGMLFLQAMDIQYAQERAKSQLSNILILIDTWS